MSAMLACLAAVFSAIAIEVALAGLLAGRGRRRAVLAAALWGNLTFESISALIGFSGGIWPAVGLVVLLLGETIVYETLTPLRAYPAFALTLLTNSVAGMLLTMFG